MLLQKTEKGRAEVRARERGLGQRERSVLLLADGNKSVADFQALFDGAGAAIALRLVQQGFLEVAPATPAFRPDATGAVATPVRAVDALRMRSATAVLPDAPAQSQAPAPPAADSFEGKRSLATTRMFLFDICERMFARRSPQLAERFREALRNARDREAMLAAGRAMLEEIESVAGPERADSISERIAMLLPPEAVA